jgi:hypothetical protein
LTLIFWSNSGYPTIVKQESNSKMEMKKKKDVSKVYFKPLKSFRYNSSFHHSVANTKQLVLAKNLNRSYNISEGNILRLITYADIALKLATESEINFYYSDMMEIADFEKDPTPIEKIIFKGRSKSFEITSPYLIDRLYISLLDIMDFQKILKKGQDKNGQASASIIKKVATEIYNELTTIEKLSSRKAYCIVGFIFAFYKIGLKPHEPILTEKEFEIEKKTNKIFTGTYLQYLSKQIEAYIII